MDKEKDKDLDISNLMKYINDNKIPLDAKVVINESEGYFFEINYITFEINSDNEKRLILHKYRR